ncbi:MAG TPA: hypothetical protein VKL99_09615 [Candidatus Angelobacter sp.]|nr:hypothetical protein [Candidatus Angelobacter sp.]
MKLRAALLFTAISFSALFAQQQQSVTPERAGIARARPEAPAPPPQTARQALIEVITGGRQAAMRHLTVEMQNSLKTKGNKSFDQDLAVFDEMKAGAAALQTFDTGQVLLSFNEPGTNEKLEVHVDSDDLSGDADNIELSFHHFQDGLEQDLPYTDLLSHFTIGLKKQENIWRLNDISIGIKVPVGDPALLEKIGKNMNEVSMLGAKVRTGESGKSEPPQMTAEQSVMMMAFAEDAYAQRHPETGFTCSLMELGGATSFNLDERIFKGEPYSGYKFTLSGCQGKPAESFHVLAEPLSPGAGAKAYCTDATRNVRSSDDGRGATCLISGKARNSGDEGSAGRDTVTFHTTTKPDPK